METARASDASHRTFVERVLAPLSFLCFLGIFAYAIATRAFGLAAPYYQDEYKWALAAGEHYREGWIPHPFLSEFLYHYAGLIAGYAHLRILPALVSLAIIVLLFFMVRRFHGTAAGLWAAGIYTASLYALVGSLQIDIDGAFLPLAALIAFWGYSIVRDGGTKNSRMYGAGILAAGLLLGFALKLSFILVPVAIVADFLLRQSSVWSTLRRPRVLLGGAALLIVALVSAWLFSDRIGFVSYVGNFIALSGRDYFQAFFQTAKALIYLSPLPVLGVLLGFKYRKELSVWFLYAGMSLLFYLVVFDFTHRTLDRYLLVLVLPLSVIVGVGLARLTGEAWVAGAGKNALVWFFGSAAFLAAATHLIFSYPHQILPLIPKSAFLAAFARGEWSLLVPLTGGSGPTGFYLPLDALAFLWGISVLAIAGIMYAGKNRAVLRASLAIFLAASLVYNIYGTIEYLRGTYFGSSAEVTRSLLLYIEEHPEVDRVITYNDIGAYELVEMDVYSARFYAHSSFIPSNAEKFRKHQGFYLIVDMPQIGVDSVYTKYFAGCAALSEAKSGFISGSVLDCRRAPLTPFEGL